MRRLVLKLARTRKVMRVMSTEEKCYFKIPQSVCYLFCFSSVVMIDCAFSLQTIGLL